MSINPIGAVGAPTPTSPTAATAGTGKVDGAGPTDVQVGRRGDHNGKFDSWSQYDDTGKVRLQLQGTAAPGTVPKVRDEASEPFRRRRLRR